MIQAFVEDQIIGQRVMPGLTPNFILAELAELPLVNTHLRKNSQEIQQRFLDIISRMPSKSDSPGYIYGFRNKSQYDSKSTKYEIKLGRTKKDVPQQRIFEWQREDNHQYVQIFTVRSEFNVKLQILVHLVFAYARKTLTINGKKRIEWFQFQQKVATAAITNLLNMLMQKIHQKYIDKVQESPNYASYQELVQSLYSNCNIYKNQLIIAAFGLPKTGKTTFKSIFHQEEINVETERNKFKLVVKKSEFQKKALTSIMEISPIQQTLAELKQLEHYFTNWLKLCCNNAVFPILVVKQSDLQSSSLVGVTQGMSLIEKYAKIQQSLTIVVTKTRQNFKKQDVLQNIAQNEKFIGKKYFDVLNSSQFIFIKQPQSTGLFISTGEIINIKKTLLRIMSNQEWMKLQLNVDSSILPFCFEIIQKSYEVLQQLYADRFQKIFLQYIQQQDQVQLLHSLHDLVNKMKLPQNQNHITCFNLINQLVGLLELSQKAKVQTYLYLFCEFCSNKTIMNTNIFEKIAQKMSQKMVQITSIYNRRLADNLQAFKKAIMTYIHNENRNYVSVLKQIIQSNRLQEMQAKMLQMVQQSKESQQEEIKNLAQAITVLMQTVQLISNYTQKGLRFDAVEGRIRQAVYYGIKSEAPSGQIKKVKPFSPVKQTEVQSIERVTHATKLSQLLTMVSEFKQGITILNFSDQIQFDIAKPKVTLKNNIFIFSKCVKAYSSTQFSFGTVRTESNQRRKLKLFIVAEGYLNSQNIVIPIKSPNGDGLCLYLNEQKITQIHPQGKKSIQNQKTFEQLKAIYRSKIK